jgi:hypothetical protein
LVVVADEQDVRVKISYAPERERIGTVEQMPRAQAAALVAEGRGTYVDENGEPLQRRRRPAAQPSAARPLLTPPPQDASGQADDTGTADADARARAADAGTATGPSAPAKRPNDKP